MTTSGLGGRVRKVHGAYGSLLQYADGRWRFPNILRWWVSGRILKLTWRAWLIETAPVARAARKAIRFWSATVSASTSDGAGSFVR